MEPLVPGDLEALSAGVKKSGAAGPNSPVLTLMERASPGAQMSGNTLTKKYQVEM